MPLVRSRALRGGGVTSGLSRSVTLETLGVADGAVRRQQMGLTVESFAVHIGVSWRTVHRAERGEAVFTGTAARIVAGYGPDAKWRRRFSREHQLHVASAS